ncbi:MAG: glycosyl hydrolase-related protein, partial [Shimia sp.]
QGLHVFTYALFPHDGDWRGDVLREAYELNLPFGPAGEPASPLVQPDRDGVVVETVKPAEDGDGIIVRLFEAHRSRGPVTLTFPQPLRRIERCTILEETEAVLAVDADTVTLDISPFEIVSLRLV